MSLVVAILTKCGMANLVSESSPVGLLGGSLVCVNLRANEFSDVGVVNIDFCSGLQVVSMIGLNFRGAFSGLSFSAGIFLAGIFLQGLIC